MSNGILLELVTGILVLLLVGFNAWVGQTLVQVKERVTRLETKIDGICRAPSAKP